MRSAFSVFGSCWHSHPDLLHRGQISPLLESPRKTLPLLEITITSRWVRTFALFSAFLLTTLVHLPFSFPASKFWTWLLMFALIFVPLLLIYHLRSNKCDENKPGAHHLWKSLTKKAIWKNTVWISCSPQRRQQNIVAKENWIFNSSISIDIAYPLRLKWCVTHPF